jgi:diguanylate cyclase (GGDEF)-like protein
MSRSPSRHEHPAVVVVGDAGLAEDLGPLAGQVVVSVDNYLQAIGEMSRRQVSAVVGRISPMAAELGPTVRALRRVNRDAKLLLVTDAAGEPDARRAVRLGVDDYLIEPLRHGELYDALGRLRSGNGRSAAALVPAGADSLIDPLLGPSGSLRTALIELVRKSLGGPVRLIDKPDDDLAGCVALNYMGACVGYLASDEVASDRLALAADEVARWVALDQRHRRLAYEASHDDLTGACNRRYFTRALASLLERAHAERFRVMMMVYDIDDFMHYNDRYGHAAGDEILRETAHLMRSVVRKQDIVARIGGDEFAVIFWDAEAKRKANSEHPRSIRLAARRFQQAICEHRFPKLADLAPGTLTISGGLASYPWDGRTPDELMHAADEMLLVSKKQGKNALTFGPGALRLCHPETDAFDS